MAKDTKFKKGEGGRPKGSKNKFTTIKDAFVDVFFSEEINGAEGLKEWVKADPKNKEIFFGWMTKMFPKDMNVTGSLGMSYSEGLNKVRDSIESSEGLREQLKDELKD